MTVDRSPRVIRYEQAVYGSFPFWDRGYAVLARSPGVRPEWLAAFQAACQGYGEPPRGAAAASALFMLRLPDRGPYAIVGVSPQGTDDRGRPGALAFHALFVAPRELRKAGFNPFALAGALGRDWKPETTLSAESRVIAPGEPAGDEARDEATRIALILSAGRRVALEAAEPIEALARETWSLLPERVRRRASVATWAFANTNRFDLAAFPRLASVALDASYTTTEPSNALPSMQSRRGFGQRLMIAALVIAAIAGLAFAWLRPREAGVSARGGSRPPDSAATADQLAPPSRQSYADLAVDPSERARVVAALIEFAERFGVAGGDDFGPDSDPADVMTQIAERLRYRGPVLSADELSRLRHEPAALAWHEQILRYLPDRPLPRDFARGPLRWQLDVLAWSFHIPPDPRAAAAEVPSLLDDALSVPGPIRPGPLAERFPTLAAYAEFLDRRPRR